MSGLIPRSFIDELLARADIVEVIDSRVTLKKAGANYTACCPFHSEKTPSFVVSPAKQIYHCFGCGAGGNTISFIMEHDRLEFVEAIESLALEIGMEVPREAPRQTNAAKPLSFDLYNLLEQVAKFYKDQLRLTATAIAYLKQRNMTGQIAKSFGIGYAPAGWNSLSQHFKNDAAINEQLLLAGMLIKKDEGGYYDRFRERIMFPIRDKRGRIIGFGGRIIQEGTPKYLNSPETPIFHKGRELYGLYWALQVDRELPRVLVVEGYMDVVMLAQHGINFAVATLGTATSADHIKSLNKLTKEIIFCFDGDKAGQTAAWRALETALPVIHDEVQIKFLVLPEGDDPDSLIQKEGYQAFIERLASALSLSDFLFSQLMAQINLASLDGKAHFAKRVGNYLKKVPEGIFKHMLFNRLAQLVRIDEEKLRAIIDQDNYYTNKTSPKPRAIKPLTISPMRTVIALLIQYPQLAPEVLAEKELVLALQLPGSDILKALLLLLEAWPNASTAALLEHWRDKSEHGLLNRLAMWENALVEENILTELLGALQRLKQLNETYLIEQYSLHYQELGPDAKQQLLELIAKKNKS